MAEIEYYTGDKLQQTREEITNRLVYARQYWAPLHARQDYWMNMYLLLDPIQQSKPLGRRRFSTNEPRTAVDVSLSILTRNDWKWRGDVTLMENENKDTLRTFGKVERALAGIVYDIDDLFTARGEPAFWKQVGLQALLRGWVWAKCHLTTEALKYHNTPLIPEVYDSRCVLPLFDQFGLNCVFIEKLTTLGDLMMIYPDKFADYKDKKGTNPWTPAVKVEYWSNTRGETPGITCALATIGASELSLLETPLHASSRFLIEPYEHGYTPEALPVQGVAVNGANIKNKPGLSGVLANALAERADLLGLQMLSWHGPGTWVADSGRSILSAVEDQIPQYNELIATIFQHFTIGTYGTWVLKTRTGEPPQDFDTGIEAKIVLRPEESAQRYEPAPITPDAYRLMDILTQERQKGVMSNILHAVGPFPGIETGIMLQQITNAALNSLEPYMDGMKRFGVCFGNSIIKQLQLGRGEFSSFQVTTPPTRGVPERLEFDPKTDLDPRRRYRLVPIPKPALPDDLTVRLTAARMALDPRRPLLSLLTVLEQILQVEDPVGEVDRIWEDIAQTDPVIVAEQIADAMERLGEPEMAARMRETEFRTKMIEDLKFRQITGNIPGLPGREAGPGPETGAPTATRRTGETAQRGGMENEGAALLGAAMGETMMP